MAGNNFPADSAQNDARSDSQQVLLNPKTSHQSGLGAHQSGCWFWDLGDARVDLPVADETGARRRLGLKAVFGHAALGQGFAITRTSFSFL
jgi:hypothetical protein